MFSLPSPKRMLNTSDFKLVFPTREKKGCCKYFTAIKILLGGKDTPDLTLICVDVNNKVIKMQYVLVYINFKVKPQKGN